MEIFGTYLDNVTCAVAILILMVAALGAGMASASGAWRRYEPPPKISDEDPSFVKCLIAFSQLTDEEQAREIAILREQLKEPKP